MLYSTMAKQEMIYPCYPKTQQFVYFLFCPWLICAIVLKCADRGKS